MSDFLSPEEEDFLNGESRNEKYWRKKLRDQPVLKAPAPKSLWGRFMQGLEDTASLAGEGINALGGRKLLDLMDLDKDYLGLTEEELDARNLAKIKEERERRAIRDAADPAWSEERGVVENIGHVVSELAGGMAGDANPTYLLGSGAGTPLGRILTQGSIEAGLDSAVQVGEIQEGLQDGFSLSRAEEAFLGGAALQGAGELVAKGVSTVRGRGGRRIRSGYRRPEFASLEQTVLDLEGGGTLDNPKTSPAGAMGPMQVMPDTARDPGFGIRPWDGKSQADLARVGRQYLAAMTDRYNGDHAKILAAYNAGPGRVDNAVKHFGPNWLAHMPEETLNYVKNGLNKLGVAPDGAVGNVQVASMDPREIAKIMGDKDMQDALNEKQIAEDLMRQADSGEADILTPAERQEMDASVDPRDVPNLDSSHEKFTPYVDTDSLRAANDTRSRRSAGQVLRDLWKDESGSYRGPGFDGKAGAAADLALTKEADDLYKSGLYDSYEDAFKAAKNSTKFKQEPWTEEDLKYDEDEDLGDDDINLDIDDWDAEPDLSYEGDVQPFYDYSFDSTQTPYGQYQIKNGKAPPYYDKKAFEELANKHGVHQFDIAEAVYNDESVKGLNVKQIQDEYVKTLMTVEKEAKEEFYPPYNGFNGIYYSIEDWELKNGKKIGPLTKQAINDYAELIDRHPDSIASHFLSETGHPELKAEVASYRDDLAKKIMTKKEYAAYQKLPTTDPKVLKILAKYLTVDVKPLIKKQQSAVSRAVDTFLRMLKDESGRLSDDPETIHKAITAWEKGTHRLLKGEDGTPIRLYHGTNIPYEGLPSGEMNRRPKGFVLYATDPDFANTFAQRSYYGKESDQRVFPVYAKNSKRIADFRKPEHVEKAFQWYKNRYDSSYRVPSKRDLETGHWSYWEEPEMIRDNGWDGAFVTEAQYDKHGKALNLMIKDDLVYSIFDPTVYGNNTVAHKIVRILKALLKDESGSYRGPGFDGRDDGRLGEDFDNLDPEDKLDQALKEAKPARREQTELYRAERAQRGARLDKIQQEGRGLEGYYQGLKSMKGELPKVDYESIADRFSNEDRDILLNRINESRALLPYEKAKAQTAILNMIGEEGVRVPTPGEIELLQEVFSKNLTETVIGKQIGQLSTSRIAGEVLNMPRSYMSSADLSGIGRQAALLVGDKEFWTAYPQAIKNAMKEENYQQMLKDIKNSENYILAKKSGLAVQDTGSLNLTDREDFFMSNFAEHIPLEGKPVIGGLAKTYNKTIGKAVRASDRAYGVLRKIRMDVFERLIEAGREQGVEWEKHPEKVKVLSEFINSATGRGSLEAFGFNFESAAPLLNAIFFSPRLNMGRLRMMSPFFIYKMARTEPFIAKTYGKTVGKFMATQAMVLSLAVAAGATVETDPRSSDGYKIKIGDTRIDTWGGFQQFARLFAQNITEETKTQKGDIRSLRSDEYKADTVWDVNARFFTNKFAPIPSVIRDWWKGANPVGEEFSASQKVSELITPLGMQSVLEALKKEGPTAAWVMLPSFLGIGIQTYEPPKPKKKGGKSEGDKFLRGESEADAFLTNDSFMSKEEEDFLKGGSM